MTITIRQLELIVTGSGGKVEPDATVGGYRLLMPSGMSMFGTLTELAQLGLESDDVQIWADRVAWIKPGGVTGGETWLGDGQPLHCPDCGQQYARAGQPGVDSALRKHFDNCEDHQHRVHAEEPELFEEDAR